MKIAFVHNAYGRLSGEEVVVENLMSILKDHGQEVVTFFRSSEEIPKMRFGAARAFFSGIYNPWSRRAFARFLDQQKPDVVHIHNVFPLISPSILPECRRQGVPVVMTLHNFRLICPNGLLMREGRICHDCLGGKEYRCVVHNCERSLPKSLGYALRTGIARNRRWFLDHVDRFICLTKFQRDLHVQNGFPAERCVVIPNPIPREFLSASSTIDHGPWTMDPPSSGTTSHQTVPAPHRPTVPPSDRPTAAPSHRPTAPPPYVGCVMRISPEKDIETLLAAARLLPDIPFKIAGSTERMPEVVSMAPSNVEFVGHLGPADLKRFYQRMRLLVFPTRCYEGMPMVLVEAAAKSIPIVCTRIGGLPEIVDGSKTGLLYELGDATGLVKCIEQLWNNAAERERFGRGGAQFVAETLHPDSIWRQLLGAYKKAWSDGGQKTVPWSHSPAVP